jgi:aminocarboxymuconate-semialdehyde decarboxylase
MSNGKNRYGPTAARVRDADLRRGRRSAPTIDIHAHIIVPAGAAIARPHLDPSGGPLARFADAATKEINALQERDRAEILTSYDRRFRDLDTMGIDMQLVAPAPGQCYYAVDAGIAAQAHRVTNEGVADYCGKHPDRLMGLGVVTLQEPDQAVADLAYAMGDCGLKGAQILTNVNGDELSDPRYAPFFAEAERRGAFVMMHPNGFTHGDRFKRFYFGNIIGNPLETTIALHNLIFSGTLARFPALKLMAVHGGGFLPGYSGRMDHAWGARDDAHGDLPLPPTTYLRQVFVDTVVFSSHQLAYLVALFGPEHILMGSDYPFDMGEYDPVAHVAGIGLNQRDFEAITGGNAARLLIPAAKA